MALKVSANRSRELYYPGATDVIKVAAPPGVAQENEHSASDLLKKDVRRPPFNLADHLIWNSAIEAYRGAVENWFISANVSADVIGCEA